MKVVNFKQKRIWSFYLNGEFPVSSRLADWNLCVLYYWLAVSGFKTFHFLPDCARVMA